MAEELNSIFQGTNRRITSADLVEMKYLERVIKETLRLYPSVPVIARYLQNDLQLGESISKLELHYLLGGGERCNRTSLPMFSLCSYSGKEGGRTQYSAIILITLSD